MFSGQDNLRQSLKHQRNKQIWCQFLSYFCVDFVTSVSFWRHVFCRELAAFFCFMFSGEMDKHCFMVQDYNGLYIYIYIPNSVDTLGVLR